MMLERGSRDFWVYKRDLAITAPRQQMIRQTQDGIPYLAPAAVLLSKPNTADRKTNVTSV